MTGILFTARLGSQRLPKKHLIEVAGKTFMEWLVLRYEMVFKEALLEKKARLIIATSTEMENKLFDDVFTPLNIDVFHGNPENIPQRHLECADNYGLTNIISVDGDDILCSAEASFKIYKALQENPGADMVSATGLPLGMNSSAYSVAYLRTCLSKVSGKKLETGWGRIFVDANKLELSCGSYDIYDRLRFTLDYPDDARFFQAVIAFFGDKILSVSDEELIATVQNRNFDTINSHLYERYWSNYNQLKNTEQNAS